MRRLFVPYAIFLFFSSGYLVSNAQTPNYTWRSVIVGGGGFVPGIVFSLTDSGVVFARTDMGGAYRWGRSLDEWVPLTDTMTRNNSDYMGIFSIALDPDDPNRVYMETGKYTQSWAGNGALLSSTDEGKTWNIIPLPFKVGGNEDGRGCGERLQVDPNADSILFMGTSSNPSTSPLQPALWRSTDFGASWSKVSSFPASSVDFVLFDPRSGSPGAPSKKIFVAATDTSDQGLYETTDGGTTWFAVAGKPGKVMAIRAAIADSLLSLTFSNYQGPNGATSGSVWKYNIVSGGWTNITPTMVGAGTHGFSGISLYPRNPNVIVVSTLDQWSPRDEVYLSTNGGESWTGKLINGVLDHSYAPYTSTVTPHWIACVAMDPFDSSKVMFGTGFGIWATDNIFASAPTWYFKDENLEETVPMQIVSPPFTNLLSAMGDYDGFRHDNLDVSPPQGRWNPPEGTTLSIAFASKVPSKIVKAFNAAPYGSYSTDGGTTWSFFRANRGGASYPAGTSGGGTWAIAISADGQNIIWSPAGVKAPYYSTDNGRTWNTCAGGSFSNPVPADPPIADPLNSDKFYIFNGLYYGQVWVSTDGGRTFHQSPIKNIPAVPGYQSQDASVTAVPGREGDLWFCAGDNGLYHSVDSGNSAAKATTVGSAYLLGFGKARPESSYPAMYLWGKVNGTLGIFRSDDSSQTWVRINDDGHQFGYLHQISGDMRVYGRCYISAEGRGILCGEPPNSDTTDNPSTFRFNFSLSDSLYHFNQAIAASWTTASDPAGHPLTYIMHFFGPGVDTTYSTQETSANFPAGIIQPSSAYVLTGWVTNGFDTTATSNSLTFLTSSLVTAIKGSVSDVPAQFGLFPNYPNPFNPTTSITYQLSAASRVTLKIYDLLGREVKALVNESQSAGRHEASFDGQSYSSGVYICRLAAVEEDGERFDATQRLVLIK